MRRIATVIRPLIAGATGAPLSSGRRQAASSAAAMRSLLAQRTAAAYGASAAPSSIAFTGPTQMAPRLAPLGMPFAAAGYASRSAAALEPRPPRRRGRPPRAAAAAAPGPGGGAAAAPAAAQPLYAAAASPSAAADAPGAPPTAFPVAGAALRALQPGDSVDVAVAAAAAVAGRAVGEAERSLIERLHANWYGTAADLSAMSREDARALHVPLRILSFVTRSLGSSDGSSDASSSGSGRARSPSPSTSHAKEGDGSSNSGAAAAAAAAATAAARTSGVSSSESGPDAGTASLLAAGGWGVGQEAEGGSPEGSRGDDDGDERGSGAAVGGEEDDLSAVPIMQRRAPPRRREFKREHIRVTKRTALPPYGLREEEMSPALRDELSAYATFSTTRFYGQRVEPISAATLKVDLQYIKMMMGWLHRFRGVPLESLSLHSMFPDSSEGSVAAAFDFVEFLINERKANPRTQFNTLITCVHIVRFLYHSESKADPANPRAAPYGDLPLMKALKTLVSKAHKAVKKAPLVADERLKWLEWGEFLALVKELRRDCAGLTASGAPRSRKEVALCLQRYLIFSILSCVPDRQRTLRELELGRTLLKENGRWVIRHSPEDYKTGKLYGQRPPLVIASFVYPELEAFIDEFRAELKPQHDFLFSRASGLPMTDNALYDMFVNTTQRRTGKATNPHLIRDMVVTHLRSQGTSENEMEALAIYMGHSITMQRDTYDRRTREQKVSPAVALMDRLSQGAA